MELSLGGGTWNQEMRRPYTDESAIPCPAHTYTYTHPGGFIVLLLAIHLVSLSTIIIILLLVGWTQVLPYRYD